MRIIVAGIGTEIGKTVVSAILSDLLEAEYWKPIQAGSLDRSDSMILTSLRSRTNLQCYPEAYRFSHACSPHAASSLEGITIDLNRIEPPNTNKNLIIEMAGGLLSPLTDTTTQCDLFATWNFHWVLVSKHYLGSINHTLLAIDYMKKMRLPLLGVIFNGNNLSSESFILNYAKTPFLGRINEEKVINKSTIKTYVNQWQKQIPHYCVSAIRH